MSNKLLVGAASTVMILALLEGGSHLVGSYPARPDPLISNSPDDLVPRVYDHLLFWRMRPNFAGNGVETNSLGLRGPEVSRKKGDEFRVLSLGESTTCGVIQDGFIAYEACYSALLETQIGSLGGRPVRVINGGVPGYSLVQGYVFLISEGLDLEPDALLLYFGGNDFLPVSYRLKHHANASREPIGGLNDWTLYERRNRPLSRASNWLHERSHFMRTFSAHLAPTDEGVIEQADASLPRVPAPHRKSILGRITALCEENDIHLTVIIPYYRQFERHEELLRTFTANAGVTVVDLPRRLARGRVRRQKLFVDQLHPNEEGHRLFAREILEVVREPWELHSRR